MSEPITMWPCEMPPSNSASPQNNLRVGMVVMDARDPTRRGIVVEAPSHVSRENPLPMTSNDAVIRLSSSTSCVTDNHERHWVEVPKSDMTTEERVRSLQVVRGPEPDDIMAAFHEYHLFDALLDGDYPTSYDYLWDIDEMAVALARRIDALKRIESQQANPQ